MGEIDKIKTEEDLEKFLLNHGENIVDCLGEQVPFYEHTQGYRYPSYDPSARLTR